MAAEFPTGSLLLLRPRVPASSAFEKETVAGESIPAKFLPPVSQPRIARNLSKAPVTEYMERARRMNALGVSRDAGIGFDFTDAVSFPSFPCQCGLFY